MGLFGGDKKVDLFTTGQRNLFDAMSGQLQSQIGQPGPQYTGPTVPTDNPTQQAAFGYAGSLLGRLGAPDAAIASMLKGQSANAVDPQAYYRDAVLNPANQAYQDAQRQLEAQYGGSWGQTGAFQDVMQENAARYGTGIGQIMAQLALENQDRSNQQRALGVQSSFGQTNDISNTLGTMLTVGGEQRGQVAEKNAGMRNEWEAQQAYNNPWLGFLGPVLGTSSFGIGQERGLVNKIIDPAGLLGG